MKYFLAFFISICVQAVNARPNDQKLGAHGPWTVYQTIDQGRITGCYIMGTPKKRTDAIKDKKRSKSYLVLKAHPKDTTPPTVSYIAGIDLLPDTLITLKGKRASYKMYTPETGFALDTAWSEDEETDQKIIQAAQQGLELRVTTEAPNLIEDVFDLTGFTAAYATMARVCHLTSPRQSRTSISAFNNIPKAFSDRRLEQRQAKKKRQNAQNQWSQLLDNATINVDASNWAHKKKKKTKKNAGTQTDDGKKKQDRSATTSGTGTSN